MEPTPETLNAFVDGELPSAEMQQIEALLKQRPELAAFVEQQLQLRRDLADGFAPVMAQAIPERLREMVLKAPVSPQYRVRTWWRGLNGLGFLLRAGVPAAALACGVFIGVAVERGPSSSFQTTQGGQLIARGELADTLSNRLASAGMPENGPRIGISFRNHRGQDCRSFTVPGANASIAGLACREGSDWAVAALAPISAETNTAYQQASADMPSVVRGAISSMIEGEVFDAAAEREARDGGWTNK